MATRTNPRLEQIYADLEEIKAINRRLGGGASASTTGPSMINKLAQEDFRFGEATPTTPAVGVRAMTTPAAPPTTMTSQEASGVARRLLQEAQAYNQLRQRTKQQSTISSTGLDDVKKRVLEALTEMDPIPKDVARAVLQTFAPEYKGLKQTEAPTPTEAPTATETPTSIEAPTPTTSVTPEQVAWESSVGETGAPTPTTVKPAALEFSVEGAPTPQPSPKPETAKFGAARPYTTGTHLGLDLAYTEGTPFTTPTAGKVLSLSKGDKGYGYDGTLGNWVRIGTDKNNYVVLGHFKKLPKDLTEGKEVRLGDYVGDVGMTGNAEGTYPHVHIQLKVNGKWVDPLTQFPEWEQFYTTQQ